MTLAIIVEKTVNKIKNTKSNTQITINELLDEEDRKFIKEKNIDMFDLTETVLETLKEDASINLMPLNDKGVTGLPWTIKYIVKNIEID